jgi:D-tyrosyl-tRNA(Tyr) deacylase|tara:strand:- start:832 stop:1275 length:444 start_codon:yes stop_codon:yes gene_type:complete
VIALLQRVNRAHIRIEGLVHASIEQGLLAFIGVEKNDSVETAEKLLSKLLAYRIFTDAEGRMNLDVKDIAGGLLLVSQFTLAANTNKGLRPSFSSAMPPADAEQIYNHMVAAAKQNYEFVESGKFAADMKIELENDGPVTFILKVLA